MYAKRFHPYISQLLNLNKKTKRDIYKGSILMQFSCSFMLGAAF